MALQNVKLDELAGINLNALEGITQGSPTVVKGFDLDREGGYTVAFGTNDSPFTSVSASVQAYTVNGDALLNNQRIYLDNTVYDYSSSSLAGKTVFLVPRVGGVGAPVVGGADTYSLGAFFKDSLGNVGDLNRITGVTVSTSGSGSSVSATTYRFLTIVEAPTSVGFLAYQVDTTDHTVSASVDSVTVTLDSTVPLGYAARCYWWDTNSNSSSFFQVEFQKISDGSALSFTLDDTTSSGSTQNPTSDALIAFGDKVVEPHRQRVWGVAGDEAFTGPFAAGLSAEKYFQVNQDSSTSVGLFTGNSSSLDPTSSMSGVFSFNDGIDVTASGEVTPTSKEWSDTPGAAPALAAYGDGGVVAVYGSQIRRYNSDGTTAFNVNLAGFGQATDVVVDDDGNVYAVDGSSMVKLNSAGTQQWSVGGATMEHDPDRIAYDDTHVYTVATTSGGSGGMAPSKWLKSSGNKVWTGTDFLIDPDSFTDLGVTSGGRVYCYVANADGSDWFAYWRSDGSFGGESQRSDTMPEVEAVTNDNLYWAGREQKVQGGPFHATINGTKRTQGTKYVDVDYNRQTGDVYAAIDGTYIEAFLQNEFGGVTFSSRDWRYDVGNGGTISAISADSLGNIFIAASPNYIEKVSVKNEWDVVLADRGTQFQYGVLVRDAASKKQEAQLYFTIDGNREFIGDPIPNSEGATSWDKGTEAVVLKGRDVTWTVDLTDGTSTAVQVVVKDMEGSTDFTRSSSVNSNWSSSFPSTNLSLSVVGLNFVSDLTFQAVTSFYSFKHYTDGSASTVVAQALASDVSASSTSWTATSTGETWTLDSGVVSVQGGLSNVTSTLPSGKTLVYTDIRNANSGGSTNYVFLDFQNSSKITGIRSSPAGLLVFGQNETFLVRGDPAGSNFEVQRVFGTLGNDEDVRPGLLGGIVFPIWRGRVYSVGLGMGDVDFGSGVNDISEPVWTPDDPFVQVVGDPNTREVLARSVNGRILRYTPSRQAWFTDVYDQDVNSLIPHVDVNATRYVKNDGFYVVSDTPGTPTLEWEDIDLGSKVDRKMFRRVYFYTNDTYNGTPSMTFDTGTSTSTITASREGTGEFLFTFPHGTVATKLESLTVSMSGAVQGDTVESPMEVEWVPRYRRR